MLEKSEMILLVDTFYAGKAVATQSITLVFENRARLPVSIFLHGERSGNSNLLDSGQSREVKINLSDEWDGGEVAVYVGNYGMIYRVEYFDIQSAPYPINVTYVISYNKNGLFEIQKSWRV